ncbi:HlyD family efflux transporter periplasmic adaptor subunit [Duganella sp. FT92W]|uniref:HlyD family efflux transporter periplasmic adaptor subunit n=1 Tax=Pseudoduganella rivuli TaxID=2666085 RepID=A0A7X2LUF7_9BURK|nr:HlyD family efflux transporter periplasmic adaptor subunit [Pseudoduganella rivuli]MRV74356.1 HlyD family efflux transporter periplasmic adaptor subunit [Pseudoduganella rivuli]
MSRKQLYRQDALDARQISWIGDIVLARPVSFSTLTAMAVGAAVALVLFLCFGTYTKRSTVIGQLVPDNGLIKVYAAQPGIIERKAVEEGQQIRQGDVLYVISSERYGSGGSDVQASVSAQVHARLESLQAEEAKTRTLHGEERAALNARIEGLEWEADKVRTQIDGQKSRVKLSEANYTRYQSLSQQGFISSEQLQQRNEDLLDQRARLQVLERDQLALARELKSQRAEASSLALRQQNQLAQLARALAGVDQEFTESEAKRRLVITAPQAGAATALVAEPGQTVDPSKVLANIVPAGATLQAHLYAPSSAIGFIHPGQQVMLRYQAFPYQKFGHARGKVLSVSKAALSSSELLGEAGGEAMYRITVALASQSVRAYGREQPLQPGMRLQADILQETRNLYEWVLEPLYSLTGKL